VKLAPTPVSTLWKVPMSRVYPAVFEYLVIASLDQTGGPARALHGPRVVDGSRGADHVAWFLPLRLGDSPHRDLCHPVLDRENGQTRRPGINGTVWDDPSILARLSSIKPVSFQADQIVQHDGGGDDFVGDVRGVLPVMRKRGLRQLIRRRPVREGHRTQSGIAYRRKVKLHHHVLPQRMRIVESKAHDEIVRVLGVHQRLTVRGLSGLK